jgi:hypothetical protein
LRALTVVAAAVLLEGCTPAQRTPATSGRADTGTVRAETLAATPPPAVTERRAPQQNAAAARAFVGTWDFAPPAGQRGPHLSITVDSVRDNQIFGRITRALSGDMETSSMFAPFRGQVDQNGVARADITTREAQSRAVHVAGAIENGAWVLTSLVWGEEQAAGGTVWRGRKAP